MEVNSTEELMSIVFKTDKGFREKGFHAIWKSIKQDKKITGETTLSHLIMNILIVHLNNNRIYGVPC